MLIKMDNIQKLIEKRLGTPCTIERRFDNVACTLKANDKSADLYDCDMAVDAEKAITNVVAELSS